MDEYVWVATGLRQELTGIERITVNCIRASSSKGSARHNLLVDRGANWLGELPGDVAVWPLPRRTGGVARRPDISQLPENLARSPVIAHSFGAPMPSSLDGLMSYTIHDWGPWFDRQIPTRARLAWCWAMWAGIRDADLIHFISQSTAEDTPRALRTLLKGKQKVYGLPYRLPRRPSASPRRNAIPGTVLSVGTDVPRKRFGLLAAACRALPSAKLTLVGAGTETYHDISDSSGAAVRGMGRVSEPVLEELYDSSQLFALVSTYEGLGLPVLEAWSRGCSLLLTESVARRLPGEVVTGATLVPDDCTPRLLASRIEEALTKRQNRPRESTPAEGRRLVDLLQERQLLLTGDNGDGN